MKIKATLFSLSKDWNDNNFLYTFASKVPPENIEKLRGKDLDIEFDIHREHRSLTANGYFHSLVDKIADELKESKTAAKNSLICRYGQPLFIGEEIAVIKTQIPPEQMREAEAMHAKVVSNKHENGKDLFFYQIYRGSSELNTKEMAILIDGTVEEAKALGIQTITENERTKLLEKWAENQY